jgi:hypothetical protein
MMQASSLACLAAFSAAALFLCAIWKLASLTFRIAFIMSALSALDIKQYV